MEHLNRILKDYLLGLGAVSESTIIQIGRSLRKLMVVTAHFDVYVLFTRRAFTTHAKMLAKTYNLWLMSYGNQKYLTTYQGVTTRHSKISSYTSHHMLTRINYLAGYKGIKRKYQTVSNTEIFYTICDFKNIVISIKLNYTMSCILDDIQYCGAIIKGGNTQF